MHHQLNNLPQLRSRRKQLRNNLTPAEAALWTMLQRSQLDGRKFRRQHSVGYYILDFYCPAEKLAIELNGEPHFREEQMKYDQERTKFLNSVGITVIRFENREVFERPEEMLEEIRRNFGSKNKNKNKNKDKKK